MKVAYIDDLKIHDISDPTLKSFLTIPIKGLEYPQMRMDSYDRPGSDGIFIANMFASGRLVSLPGKLFNINSEAEYTVQRRQFLALMAPRKDDDGLLIKKTFRFTLSDNVEYIITGQVRSVDMPMANPRNSDFLIQFLADNLYIEAYSQSSTNVYKFSAGGFIVPFELPLLFDSGSGGDISITNSGDSPAYPIITLHGPLTSPRIYNLTLDKSIGLSLSINSGESVEIDMKARTITQGDSTNRLDSKTSDSSFFWIEPGENILRLTSIVTGESGYAEVVYRDSYMGV